MELATIAFGDHTESRFVASPYSRQDEGVFAGHVRVS
jgi:hypothetical protein